MTDGRQRDIPKPVIVSLLLVAWLASVILTHVQEGDWEKTLVVAVIMALACGVGYAIAP